MAASKSFKKSSSMFSNYKPPKQLRALFIAYYAPLLLLILIGPMMVAFEVWKLPIDFLLCTILGLVIFFLGAIVYFKSESYWHKTYKGQLVTDGIFQYIRHPHYTSLLIIGFGLALFFCSLGA